MTKNKNIIRLRISAPRLVLVALVFFGIVAISWRCYKYFAIPSTHEAYEHVAASVFIVEYSSEYRTFGDYFYNPKYRNIGSGVAVGEDEVVSNAHLINEFPGLIRVRQSDKKWRAFPSYIDREEDLCVLKVPGLLAKPAKYRPSIRAKVGDRVFTVGAPRGLESTLSDGLISGLRKFEGSEEIQLIQTTAAISPGSSGGGLFDAKSNLIGITTAYLVESQNLNFAIPINTITEAISFSRMEAFQMQARAIAYLQAGDHQKAKETIYRVTTLAPELAEAWYLRYLVDSEWRLNEFNADAGVDGIREVFEEGKHFLQKAVTLDPSLAEAWYFLSVIYSVSGGVEEMKLHSRAMEESSHRSDASQNDMQDFIEKFNEVYGMGSPKIQYNFAQSKAAIERALELQPNNIGYLCKHATVCTSLKMREEALASITKALSLDRMNISALSQLFSFYQEAEISESVKEFVNNEKYKIETAIKLIACTPRTSVDCFHQQAGATYLIEVFHRTGNKERVREYEGKLEKIKDLNKTLLGRETIEKEKDRTEAQSALVEMK